MNSLNGDNECKIEEISSNGRRGFYFFILITAVVFFAVYCYGGGFSAPTVIFLMAFNCAASAYYRLNTGRSPSPLVSYSYLMIFSYIISNFYYLDVFNALTFISSITLIFYSYRIKNAVMLFLFLLFAQIASLNIYFDFFNINPLVSGISGMKEIVFMPLIFLPFLIIAFYHKIKSETAYSGAYLTALTAGLSFYLFIVGLNPDSGAMVFTAAGFALAFTIFMLPSVESAAGAYVDVEAVRRPEGVDLNIKNAVFTVNIFFLTLAATVYVYSVYRVYGACSYFEFYSQGASLYHDAAGGYFARFNAPFNYITLNAPGQPASKIYAKKNMRVFPLPPDRVVEFETVLNNYSAAFINAAVIDIKQAGEQKIAMLDYPFLNVLIDEKKAASISPRFVYKIKAGVMENGGSFLSDYTLVGDRFLMFDENNVYNKFKFSVKNFFAVSAGAEFAAVYDFSGNVRIIDLNDSKTIMIISGIKNFISAGRFGQRDFLILCESELYRVSTVERKIETVDCGMNMLESKFYGMCCASDGNNVVAARGGVSLAIGSEPGYITSFPASIDLNDSRRVLYYDNDILVCYEYFSQRIVLYKIKRTYSKIEIVHSAFISSSENSFLNIDSFISKQDKKSILAVEYGAADRIINVAEINVDTLEKIRNVKIKIDPELKIPVGYAFRISPEGVFTFVLIFEDSIALMNAGFFYNENCHIMLDDYYKHNVVLASMPFEVESADEKLFIAAHNRVYVIAKDSFKNFKKIKVFEAAK